MITACLHGDRAKPQPCPPMCPAQMWPRYLYRLDWRGRDWVPRRRHRANVERIGQLWDELSEIAPRSEGQPPVHATPGNRDMDGRHQDEGGAG